MGTLERYSGFRGLADRDESRDESRRVVKTVALCVAWTGRRYRRPPGCPYLSGAEIKLMMRTKLMRTRSIAAVLAVLLIATSVSTARAQQPGAVHGRAYLFYGLVAMIDWGMDQLAARINRTGVLATTNSHMTWRSVADQAIADYRRDPKPISVVGHSAGGDSAVQFAEALAAAHVPVALLITYDPNRTAGSIPANVERYIDLFQSSNIL